MSLDSKSKTHLHSSPVSGVLRRQGTANMTFLMLPSDVQNQTPASDDGSDRSAFNFHVM